MAPTLRSPTSGNPGQPLSSPAAWREIRTVYTCAMVERLPDAVGKRPYLRPDARRRQLLDAASAVFLREGLTGLTMVAVANEANVSRRLVYDHFEDLGSFYEAFFEDRAALLLEAIDRIQVGTGPAGLAAAAAQRFEALLSIPIEDLCAIRLVIADTTTRDLDRVRTRIRHRLEGDWLAAARELGADMTRARAMLWTLMTAFLTLADLVERDEIDAEKAASIVNELVVALSAGPPAPG
jgi:AcrR family transcriptional regulator